MLPRPGRGVLPFNRPNGDFPLDGGRIFTTGLTIMGFHFNRGSRMAGVIHSRDFGERNFWLVRPKWEDSRLEGCYHLLCKVTKLGSRKFLLPKTD